jgi:broad specificity phosphatase PhoE
VTTFFFIRHAEKVSGNFFNPRLRHQDNPITPAGLQAAETLAEYFAAGEPLHALYISGYLRTGQTAAPLAARLGLQPIIDERLNEIDNGCIDDMPEEEIRRRYPEVWQGFRDHSYDFRFPEGETGEEARARIAAFLDDLLARHAGDTVAAVAHEGLIRLTACHVLGLPVYSRWKFKVNFCGIMQLQHSEGEWKLIRFNHTV